MRCAPTSASPGCKPTADGRLRLAHPRLAQQYRLNVGTIVEAPMLKVRLRATARAAGALGGGRVLGEIEEYFIEQLERGDTFVFAGEVVRFEGLRDTRGLRLPRARRGAEDPDLCRRQVSALDASGRARARDAGRARGAGACCRSRSREWLEIQQARSVLPEADEVLVETFPRGGRHYLVCYPFEGRLAHQTLGMLLTRRLERMRRPAARLRRQRLRAGDLGPGRSLGDDRRRPSRPRRSCSTRTCWATISRPGSPSPA